MGFKTSLGIQYTVLLKVIGDTNFNTLIERFKEERIQNFIQQKNVKKSLLSNLIRFNL